MFCLTWKTLCVTDNNLHYCEHTIPAVIDCGVRIILWEGFSLTTEKLVRDGGTMNEMQYRAMLKENLVQLQKKDLLLGGGSPISRTTA